MHHAGMTSIRHGDPCRVSPCSPAEGRLAQSTKGAPLRGDKDAPLRGDKGAPLRGDAAARMAPIRRDMLDGTGTVADQQARP